MIFSRHRPTSANSYPSKSPMHPNLQKQALEFRQVMNQTTGTFSISTLETQKRLITEEFKEFLEAYTDATKFIQNPRSREAALKELADLVYVCFQFAAAAGWELDEALDRVHKSNLSKLVDGKPVKREDGKVLKGENYKPPILTDLI